MSALHNYKQTKSAEEQVPLKSVTDENRSEIASEDKRARWRMFWRHGRWLIIIIGALVLLLSGMIAGVWISQDDSSDMTSERLRFEQQFAGLQAAYVTQRDDMRAEIVELESQLELAPTRQEYDVLTTELEAAQNRLVEADNAHEAEVLELQRSIAGLLSQRDTLAASNELLRSDVSQAEAAQSRAEAGWAKELGQLPVRLASLSLPVSRATYKFQGENTVVRESFGIHFWGWDDSVYSGAIGGLAFYDVGERPTSAKWNESEDRLRVEIGLPRLIGVGMFDFDAQSIGDRSGWISRLFNRGGASEVLMRLEQQVLQPHACNDIESLREYVDMVETEFALQAHPYPVDVLWRVSGGQSVDVPADEHLLAAAC